MNKKEKYTEKIKKFSKVVYILLRIAFVVFIVVGALELFTWILTTMETQPIIKLGNTTIYLYPVIELDDNITGIAGSSLIREFMPTWGNLSFEEILRTIFIIIALGFTGKVFKKLRDDGSPFREDIVKEFKRLAVALLVVGACTGIIGFLASGIVWVLCLIFDYGYALQTESDTTL